MAESALTTSQVHEAIRRCSPDELKIVRALKPHEQALCLEAKFFADARISNAEGEIGWSGTASSTATARKRGRRKGWRAA